MKTIKPYSIESYRSITTKEILDLLKEGKSEQYILDIHRKHSEEINNETLNSESETATALNQQLWNMLTHGEGDYGRVLAEQNTLTEEDIDEVCLLGYHALKKRLSIHYQLKCGVEKSDIVYYKDRINIIAPMFQLTGLFDSHSLTIASVRILKHWLDLGSPEDKVFYTLPSLVTYPKSSIHYEGGYVETEIKEVYDDKVDLYTGVYYDSELETFMGRMNIPASHELGKLIYSGYMHYFMIGLGTEGVFDHFNEKGEACGIYHIFSNLILGNYQFSIDGSRFTEDDIIPRPKGMTVCYPFEAKEIKAVLEVKDMVNYATQFFASDKVPVVFLREDGVKTKVGEIVPSKLSAGPNNALLYSTEVDHMIAEYPYYQIELERMALDEDVELVAVLQQGFSEL